MSRGSFGGKEGARRVRLGVIANPNARFVRSHPKIQEALAALGPRRVRLTQSIDELPQAIASLLHEEGVNVLGICGGDGTVHHTLNALVQVCAVSSSESKGLELPPVALLRGGTLNIVARALQVEGQTVRLLQRLERKFSKGPIEQLPIRQLNVLGVRDGAGSVRYGFIFGSEITALCLELYEKRFGAGYMGLARFLRAVLKAYLVKNALWRQFEPLLIKPAGSLRLEDTIMEYQAVVASTVDIKLLAGLITGMEVELHQRGMLGVRLMLPQTPTQLVRNLPNLLLGRDGFGLVDRPCIRKLELLEPIAYSFDGEVFTKPEHPGNMELFSPSWSLPVVAPLR
ncbi:MAG: hypothetical protein EP343_29775 [Deltaproteobacteria bacterium]|nr:MAG: hypothetical protein EP343_29775 [Deltaproteobacteria bacterium]